MLEFKDRIIIITGAAGGLGAAYARAFADRGAIVIVHDAGVQRDGSGHDGAPAERVAAHIRQQGGRAWAQTQNLRTKEACEQLVQNVLTKFGRVDVLVHSAGVVRYKGIEETTDNEWQTMLDVNIQAPFWLAQAVWPIMKAQNYGRIILTVSGYGLKAFDDSDVTAYGVGKAAQFGLMNGLAGEGKRFNILVNAISPVAATRIFRQPTDGDEMSPQKVVPAILAIAAADCTLSGRVVHAVDGRFGVGEFVSQLDIVPEQAELTAESLLGILNETV